MDDDNSIAIVKTGDSISAILWEDNTRIGSVIGRLKGSEFHFQDAGIDLEYRRKGFGYSLYKKVLERAKEAGAQMIYGYSLHPAVGEIHKKLAKEYGKSKIAIKKEGESFTYEYSV